MYVITAIVAAALLRPTLALLAALTVTVWLRRRRRPDHTSEQTSTPVTPDEPPAHGGTNGAVHPGERHGSRGDPVRGAHGIRLRSRRYWTTPTAPRIMPVRDRI
jgi:hypothetical protein